DIRDVGFEIGVVGRDLAWRRVQPGDPANDGNERDREDDPSAARELPDPACERAHEGVSLFCDGATPARARNERRALARISSERAGSETARAAATAPVISAIMDTASWRRSTPSRSGNSSAILATMPATPSS